MSCKLYDMRDVSVRELQREIKAILDRVEKGESVEITRRGHPVARLIPAKRAKPMPWPDLDERARSVMGRRRVTPSPSRELLDDRGDR
jgi:prevent-host-death family protein